MNYLQPDNIWKSFDVKSETDFIEKFVLKGKFHCLVPEEIVDDYKLVERLLFYSYFHYALLDEAFSKSTRIFEASVTLKLEVVGLKKKEGFESLHSKLNRLEKYCSKHLHQQWLDAKEWRNRFAHREAGVLMGVTLINALKHNLNMINSLFLEVTTIHEKENQHKILLQQSEHLLNGLFILDDGNKKILICSARPYTTGIMQNLGKSLWVFIPITGNKEIKESKDLPNALILTLEDLHFNKNGLSAIDSSTKQSISLIVTDKFENGEKLVNHNLRINEIEAILPDIILEYMAKLKHSIAKEIGSFLYEDW
ncbi:hypothetical protein SAMN05443667_11594 [Flavobacterium gillisiae]|uniref:Uncharacterized protein n=1 Tax=Flavobacterium gillisiae TaxID=150146 RepID=A0A1H4FZD3_9FLAO|nr:hypothetical protein [Flavobacterium gillisiae]SEB02028.1 hypothetical protein SAMN05443667_11594 [Flavobacterium gillisiae]